MNSVGTVKSNWTSVRTLQAPPQGLAAPTIPSTNTYGVSVSWSAPQAPNGPILEYRVYYKQASEQEQSVSVLGNDTDTFISGLFAYTEYEISVEALNDAGRVRSPPTSATTQEGYPSGLSKFNVEKITSGTAVILTWENPSQPNGEIIDYRIYQADSSVAVFQGLSRQFEFPRLLPFTQYTVSLEACTRAGCTRGEDQSFITAETMPQNQPSPVMGSVNATHITLTWSPPVNPNGAITAFEVLRAEAALRRRRRDAARRFDLLDQSDITPIKTMYEFKTSNASWSGRSSFSKFSSYNNITTRSQTGGSSNSLVAESIPLFERSLILDNDFQDNILLLHSKDTVVSSHVRKWVEPESITQFNLENEIIRRFRRQTITPPSEAVVVYQTTDTDAESFSWTDSGLSPYTQYMYSVRASNNLGQVTSPWQIVRTEQAAPSGVLPPTLAHVSNEINSLLVTWDEPEQMNGVLQGYQVR